MPIATGVEFSPLDSSCPTSLNQPLKVSKNQKTITCLVAYKMICIEKFHSFQDSLLFHSPVIIMGSVRILMIFQLDKLAMCVFFYLVALVDYGSVKIIWCIL